MTTQNLKDQARLESDERIEATDRAMPSESQGPALDSNQKSQEVPSEDRPTMKIRTIARLEFPMSQVEVLGPKLFPEESYPQRLAEYLQKNARKSGDRIIDFICSSSVIVLSPIVR